MRLFLLSNYATQRWFATASVSKVVKSMSLNAELEHVVTRTFGDEVVMATIERKCLVIAQLKAHRATVHNMAWRVLWGYYRGHIATPAILQLVWTQGLVILAQPFAADVTAAIMRAPDVVLTPNDYNNPTAVSKVVKSMSLNAELEHVVTRTFGDEVVMASIERKCLVISQLKAHRDIVHTMAWRSVSAPHLGYMAHPAICHFIWTRGMVILGRPHVADVTAAVIRAPDVVLSPNDYN